MNQTASPILVALLHCLFILAVGALPLTWKMRGTLYDALLSFGAGVLLSAAFLHMLPAAIPDLGPSTGVFLLAGYLLMTLLERFTMAHPCGEEACPNHHLGLVAFFGLSIHSVISGMALGVSLVEAADMRVSLALLSAILVHKVPETLALMGLFAASGWARGRIIVFLFLYSAMGPAGILAGAGLGIKSPWLLSCALAISAGTFLYIASSDLLPQLHKKMKQEWIHFLAFLAGLFFLSFEAWHHLAG